MRSPRTVFERVLRILLLAIVLGSLLGGLGAELYYRLRLHPPGASHVFLRPPLRRLTVSVAQDVPGLARRSTLFTTNSLGVRGDELDLDDSEVFRVVVLGGSVSECLVLDDADAWPRKLQDELEKLTGRPVWVGNAARSGEMTLDYVAHARLLLPSLRPHLVLVMVGGNDLQAAAEERYFPLDLSDPTRLATYAEHLYTKGDTQLLSPLYAYYMYERVSETELVELAPLYTRMRQLRRAAPKIEQFEDLDSVVDIYRTNLRALHGALTELESHPRVVLLTHPFLWRADMKGESLAALWAGYTCMDCQTQRFYSHAALALALGRLNAETLAFCRAQALPCFDLAPAIPKDLKHFYDDAHFKEAGASTAARKVAEHLVSKQLITR